MGGEVQRRKVNADERTMSSNFSTGLGVEVADILGVEVTFCQYVAKGTEMVVWEGGWLT